MNYRRRVVVIKISVFCCFFFLNNVDGRNCNFNVQVEQKLLGEGFHRYLFVLIVRNKMVDNHCDDCRSSLLSVDIYPEDLWSNSEDIVLLQINRIIVIAWQLTKPYALYLYLQMVFEVKSSGRLDILSDEEKPLNSQNCYYYLCI